MSSYAKNLFARQHRRLRTIACAIILTAAAPAAHAEFRFGIDTGYAKTKLSGDTENAGAADYGNTAAPFIQYRHQFAGGLQIGAHVGYGADSADVESAKAIDRKSPMEPVKRNTGEMITVDVTFNKKTHTSRINRTFDAAVLLAAPGARITPVIMLGHTSAEIETTVAEAGTFQHPEHMDMRTLTKIKSNQSKTFTGWKITAGAEYMFDEIFGGHALLYYADMDNDEVGVEQIGLRLGLVFRF